MTTAKLCTILVAALGLVPGAHANPVKSLYTTLELASCRIAKKHEDGNVWSCPGLDGWPIHLAEGDNRTYVSYGPAPEKRRAAGQTLAAFNSPFTPTAARATVEWRFVRRDGKSIPYATILRFHTSRDRARGDVLVVSKVSAEDSCHIAYVDAFANPDAIALARRIADESARGFDCRKEPTVVGRRGRSPL